MIDGKPTINLPLVAEKNISQVKKYYFNVGRIDHREMVAMAALNLIRLIIKKS